MTVDRTAGHRTADPKPGRAVAPTSARASPVAVCLGEALVDFIPSGGGEWSYVARCGGAPANVAIGLAQRGVPTAFIGRIGSDALGDLIEGGLAGAGVDTRWLQRDPTAHTTVAIVAPGRSDEQRFAIYAEGTAYQRLELEDASRAMLRRHVGLLHVGSVSLSNSASRSATMEAAEFVASAGGLVSVDVNLRPSLWADRRQMLGRTRSLMAFASVIKFTRAELEAFGGKAEDFLRDDRSIVLVTDGPAPARAITSAGAIEAWPPAANVVDATGAGDAFVAAFLAAVSRGADASSLEALRAALQQAVVAGARATSRSGA